MPPTPPRTPPAAAARRPVRPPASCSPPWPDSGPGRGRGERVDPTVTRPAPPPDQGCWHHLDPPVLYLPVLVASCSCLAGTGRTLEASTGGGSRDAEDPRRDRYHGIGGHGGQRRRRACRRARGGAAGPVRAPGRPGDRGGRSAQARRSAAVPGTDDRALPNDQGPELERTWR